MTPLNRLIARRDDMRPQQHVGRLGIAITQKQPGDLVLTSRGVVQVQERNAV